MRTSSSPTPGRALSCLSWARLASEEPRSYGWEQEIEGSPFERVLKSAAVAIELKPDDGDTVVTLMANETLRGFSRLGGPMMRGAAGSRLDDALDGIERALT